MLSDRNRLLAGGLIILASVVALQTARFTGSRPSPQAHAFGTHSPPVYTSPLHNVHAPVHYQITSATDAVVEDTAHFLARLQVQLTGAPATTPNA